MNLADVSAGALYLRTLGINGRPTLVLDTAREHPDASHFDRFSAPDLLITQGSAAELRAAIERYGLGMTIEQAHEFEADAADFTVTIGHASELACPLGDTETLGAHAAWQLVNRGFASRSAGSLDAAPQSFDDDGEGLRFIAARDTDSVQASVSVTLDDDSVRDLHAYLGAYLATLPDGPAALPTLEELETR